MRYLLLVLLITLALAATALEDVSHPDLDRFEGNVAEYLTSARAAFEEKNAAGAARGEDFGRLGMIYQAHEQYGPAKQAYRNAVELAPADARWHYFLGMLSHAEGDFDAAVDYFEAAERANSHYPAARVRLARSMIAAGRLSEAEVVVSTLRDDHPNLAVAHADLGAIAIQRNDPAAAIEHLNRALAMQPLAGKLHYQLGLAYRQLGDLDQARVHLAQQSDVEVLFDDPLYKTMRELSRSYAFFMSQGLAMARAGQHDAALALMQRAVEANPESAEARINYARMLEATGDLNRAIEAIDAVIADHPRHPLAHYNRGAMLEILAEDRRARPSYQRALELDPTMFEASLVLANSHMRDGEYEEAARAYARALEIRPGRNRLLLFQATALVAAGQCRDAMEPLLELVSRIPEDFEALMAYSRVAATCDGVDPGHRGNALNAARNMYTMNPALPVVRTLAMTEAAVGHYESAADFQRQALFLAVRDQQPEGELAAMREDLAAYEAGRGATRPWSDSHPLLHPVRLSIEARR